MLDFIRWTKTQLQMNDYVCWMCKSTPEVFKKSIKAGLIFLYLNFDFSSADGFCSEHGVTFETTIIDKFEVAFGSEGETMSLGCTVIVYPTVKKYQPDVVWYRNCK